MGWVGSAAYQSRLAPTPCGCAVINAAEKHPDERGRKVLLADGERFRAEWGCPFAKGKRAPLSARHLAVIDSLSGLIGSKLPHTCPGVHARTPNAHLVTNRKTWRDKGQLELVCPNPSLVLIQAIDALTEGCAAREAHELEDIQRKAEAARTGGK